MKRWIYIAIAVIIAFVGYKVWELIQWYDALNIIPTGKIKGMKDGKIRVNLTVALDNPKDFQISITKPTIRIYSNGTLLTSSVPSGTKVLIAPTGITYIDYELLVPVQSELFRMLISGGSQAWNQIQAGENISAGIAIEVLAYFQVFGIERIYREKITI
ncbi:MAG: hypothetical protein RBT49_15880 [Bacteroidales bacterium]|jgi:hypothetical protein|nr:hypothetical protein [Bacteroidales bacterium]